MSLVPGTHLHRVLKSSQLPVRWKYYSHSADRKLRLRGPHTWAGSGFHALGHSLWLLSVHQNLAKPLPPPWSSLPAHTHSIFRLDGCHCPTDIPSGFAPWVKAKLGSASRTSPGPPNLLRHPSPPQPLTHTWSGSPLFYPGKPFLPSLYGKASLVSDTPPWQVGLLAGVPDTPQVPSGVFSIGKVSSMVVMDFLACAPCSQRDKDPATVRHEA